MLGLYGLLIRVGVVAVGLVLVVVALGASGVPIAQPAFHIAEGLFNALMDALAGQLVDRAAPW